MIYAVQSNVHFAGDLHLHHRLRSGVLVRVNLFMNKGGDRRRQRFSEDILISLLDVIHIPWLQSRI